MTIVHGDCLWCFMEIFGDYDVKCTVFGSKLGGLCGELLVESGIG